MTLGATSSRPATRACFASRQVALLKAGSPSAPGEPAMKTWIGAMTLMALLAIGDAGAISIASAAKVITVPQQTKFVPARAQRAYRQDRAGYGPYDRGYDRAWTYYYGPPYFY